VADEKGAPVGLSGPVFPNPDNVKPVSDTDVEPEGTYHPPKGAKLDISNPVAADINPHPIHQHFQKKGAGVRKTGTPAVSEN
jgi:hypothetical protein